MSETIRIQNIPELDVKKLKVIAEDEGYKSIQDLVRTLIANKINNSFISESNGSTQKVIQDEERYSSIMSELSKINLKQDIVLLNIQSEGEGRTEL